MGELASSQNGAHPNKEFLRFAERWLSDGKADYNHYNNVSMNNYLLRVPNSINSKTNTEVKIVQRWNGVRSDVRFVYSYFLAYLVDKGNEPHHSSAISNNNWIEYCKTKINKMNTRSNVKSNHPNSVRRNSDNLRGKRE